MEKYSAFRDPGTGIQPFLPPVPPLHSNAFHKLILPVALLLGTIRTALVVLLAALYVFTQGLCVILAPVPFLRRTLSHVFTAFIARSVLILVGIYWIPVEMVTVSRKRRFGEHTKPWQVKAGDIIVCNSVSWVELLWLAFRYHPRFVAPICVPVAKDTITAMDTPAQAARRARSSIGVPNRATTAKQSQLLGFYEISLFDAVRTTGQVPRSSAMLETNNYKSIDQLQRQADRPIVVFPECTTSNGRGLLRFAECFAGESVPPTRYSVFIMCIRIAPPTQYSPSLSLPIPVKLNPLAHVFSLCTSVIPHQMSVRLLASHDSPSSPLFMVSDFLSQNTDTNDVLSECCASLMANVGKMKRVGMGWEDKSAFLDFYRGKSK